MNGDKKDTEKIVDDLGNRGNDILARVTAKLQRGETIDPDLWGVVLQWSEDLDSAEAYLDVSEGKRPPKLQGDDS